MNGKITNWAIPTLNLELHIIDDIIFCLHKINAVNPFLQHTEIMMGFEMSEYFFSEGAGFLNQSVYIVRENSNEVTVSSTFTVTVVLLHDSTATDSRLHPENTLVSLIYILFFIDSDFIVPGGFNVTITFGGLDARQPFPLKILEDMMREEDEMIQLL